MKIKTDVQIFNDVDNGEVTHDKFIKIKHIITALNQLKSAKLFQKDIKYIEIIENLTNKIKSEAGIL